MQPPLDLVISDMLSELDTHLPPPVAALPPPNVTLIRLLERRGGLGNRSGSTPRGSLGSVPAHAGRLETEVRFQLWGADPTAVDDAVLDLQGDLLEHRDALWTGGFLRLQVSDTTLAEHVGDVGAWRKTTSFEILYEYSYEDTESADSLIARIPIQGDLEERGSLGGEATTVTDHLVRWDQEGAPALRVRGPARVAALEALVFVPGADPTGSVVLRRTFEGAAGPPAGHGDPASFLAAVAGPEPAQRHAELSFPSFNDFLAALAVEGDAQIMGDWDGDTNPDEYEPRALSLDPGILLNGPGDRIELIHQNAVLDEVAVVYLRLARAQA